MYLGADSFSLRRYVTLGCTGLNCSPAFWPSVHCLFHKSHPDTVSRRGAMYGFLSQAHHEVLLTVDILTSVYILGAEELVLWGSLERWPHH